jgi:dipeptidyl aminopeptidase/acylaminoacyl peptidase
MTFSVEDHIRLRRVTSLASSPDGTWLAVALERLDRDGAKYVSDIWKVPTDRGRAVQLTRGDSKDTSPCFRHDGALGFLSNRPPNEGPPEEDAEKRMQVWILPADLGEPSQVTDEPLGVTAFRFAKRRDRLALFAPVIPNVAHDEQRKAASTRAKKGTSARRYLRQPVRHWDHWLHDNPDLPDTHLIACNANGGNRTDLTPGATRQFAIEPELDVSDDGRRVAATWQTEGEDRVLDTSVLLIEIDSGIETILGAAPDTGNEQIRFSPDGRFVALVRSVRSPERVMRPLVTLLDPDAGTERTLGESWDRWPNLAGWTLDQRGLIVTADDAGETPVFTLGVEDGRLTRITSPSSGGSHSEVRMLPDGRIAGIRSTFLRPPECFIVEAREGAEPESLAPLSGFDQAGPLAIDVESLEVPSTDGTPVQYFFLKPKNAVGPLPTSIWIHGGPIGMNGDLWHWRWNPVLAVEAGYGVALPNPRGSTGFGQEFIQGIWGNVWGGQCYEDLMAVADALGARPDVDPDRVMAMGGSFGGYMTNWIGTQTGRFRCLVTHASIFTMAQFTGVTDHPAWWYLEMGGENPYADPAGFDRYAPARHVRNWKTPTLVIHGELDYRCPIGEGLNLFEALQYHGVESEMLVFPDENHWILKPRNAVAWYETVLDFLSRHMGPTESGG